MSRRLVILLSVVGLLLLSVPAYAAPPGSSDELEESAWFDAGWEDGLGAYINLHVQTDEGSSTGAEMWVSMNSEVYGCNDMYTSTANFDYSPDMSTVTANLSTSCWEHGVEESDFPFTFTLTVATTDQAAKKIRWHTNATGTQCKGVDYVDDDIDGIAWTINNTIPGLDPVFWEVGGSYGNFHSTSQACHLTGTPGKPPKA